MKLASLKDGPAVVYALLGGALAGGLKRLPGRKSSS